MAANSHTAKSAATRTVYGGIVAKKTGGFYAAVKQDEHITVENIKRGGPTSEAIYEWLLDYSQRQNVKFIALGLGGLTTDKAERLGSRLWLKQDIVPYRFKPVSVTKHEARRICLKVASDFDEHDLVKINTTRERRVQVSHLVTETDYAKTLTQREYRRLQDMSEEMQEEKVKLTFFNSTACGGGVALMRHALIRLYELLGVDANWYVMNSDPQIFYITKKKFHNILQAVAPQYVAPSTKDIRLFKKWSKDNAAQFSGVFRKSDVIVIDDPQPSGLIPYIRKYNPDAKIIYRSHIQVQAELIDEGHEQQASTWQLIWSNVKHADLFVSHPIRKFVPAVVPPEKVVFMPATTDPLDGLNKPLSKKQSDYYLAMFNRILREAEQAPLDLKRPYIIQIARFDPSKGIPHALEAYRTLRKRMQREGVVEKQIPQLVIVGNGAIDDPEGAPLYAETLQIIGTDAYRDVGRDIKVARLPHYDQLLNALLQNAKLAFQLSLKEGFEVKVTEALAKGKPVIAYRTGGIPLQIENNVTGHLVKPGNTKQVAKHAYELLTDPNKYSEMSKNAAQRVSHDYFTANNAYKWLYLALKLAKNEPITGNFQDVGELIKKDPEYS